MGPGPRAGWSCGWLSKSRRTGPGFRPPTSWPVQEPRICPGWCIALPQVIEAARAMRWKGSLRERYEGLAPTGLLMDCLDVIEANVSDVESEMMVPKDR